MKILLISPLPPPAGGIATWTKTYLETELAKTNQVDIVNTAVIGSRINRFTTVSVLDEIPRTWNILKTTYKMMCQTPYDLVHMNTSCSSKGLLRDALCSLIVKFKRVRLIIHCRCDVTYQVKGSFQALIFKWICHKADKILVLNKVSQRYIEEKCHQKSIILPNYIDKHNIVSSPKEIREMLQTILYAGHVTIEKGCDDILKVAARFPDIKFILAGHLMNEIRMMPKPDNVVVTGELPKKKIFEYMQEADLFLFPTHTEGFPNVILEAMASGLPIIATSVGAIPDMLEDQGGIVVKVKDLDAMISAVNTLKNRDKRKLLSDWNRKKVENYYTVDIVMDRLFQEYYNF